MPLVDCLGHVSFRRYSQFSLEVVEKLTNVKVFELLIFREERPRLLYGRLLVRFTVHRLAKFG